MTTKSWHYTRNEHAFWIGRKRWNPDRAAIKTADLVATVPLNGHRTTEEREQDARLIAAAPALVEAARFTLRHVIAGLSAGTPPEPQMLAKAHSLLFAAVDAALPDEYGPNSSAKALRAAGVEP